MRLTENDFSNMVTGLTNCVVGGRWLEFPATRSDTSQRNAHCTNVARKDIRIMERWMMTELKYISSKTNCWPIWIKLNTKRTHDLSLVFCRQQNTFEFTTEYFEWQTQGIGDFNLNYLKIIKCSLSKLISDVMNDQCIDQRSVNSDDVEHHDKLAIR